MEATTQYFGKWFFINRSQNFIALLNFYDRHLGVKITGLYTILPYLSIRGSGPLAKLAAVSRQYFFTSGLLRNNPSYRHRIFFTLNYFFCREVLKVTGKFRSCILFPFFSCLSSPSRKENFLTSSFMKSVFGT